MQEISSIDDVLASATGIQAKAALVPPEPVAEEAVEETFQEKPEEVQNEHQEPQESEPKASEEVATDEYGNEKPAPRQYTQEEADEYANRIVRERLARIERNAASMPTPQQQQQAASQGFKYDAESPEDWQQQLAAFTEQVIVQREQRQMQQAHQQREERERAEFAHKFQSGMGRFNDFTDVVGNQPITDAMTEALAGIQDPSAFIYAAAKRAPQELERISRLPSKAAQMVEMGKLEERMKQIKPATKTPKPISRTQEDMTSKLTTERKEPTIEELIAKEDAKRRALQAQRRR